jgi:hypothetical protein
MRRGLGTAMQVLAGAFGGGASSLGQSRMDQQRFDVDDDQFDREYALRVRAQQAREQELANTQQFRQGQLDLQREELDVLDGLTPAQRSMMEGILEANPGMTRAEARNRARLRVRDFPNSSGAASPPPPVTRPAAPRPPRPDLNR